MIFNSWGQSLGKFVKTRQLGFGCVSARSAPGIGRARISGARDWKRCGFMVSEVRGNEYKVIFSKRYLSLKCQNIRVFLWIKLYKHIYISTLLFYLELAVFSRDITDFSKSANFIEMLLIFSCTCAEIGQTILWRIFYEYFSAL